MTWPRNRLRHLGLLDARPERPEQRENDGQKHENGDRSHPKLTLGQPERFVERTPCDEQLAAAQALFAVGLHARTARGARHKANRIRIEHLSS